MPLAHGDLHYASLSDVASLIRTRQLTSVDLADTILTRIEDLNPKLHAYYSVFRSDVLDTARAYDRLIERGMPVGPLHGVPVAIKDLFECGPTTAGSRLRRGCVATVESTVVARLRAAGALILGKLATHEFGLGASTLADDPPAARNPWKLELSPGGSSTGAGSAVAAGMAYGAVGSDTGGSIRLPAAWCGIVGLKPTYGRVSRAGLLPLSWSLDHVGPITRTVKDSMILLQVMAGRDPQDPTSSTAQVPDFTETVGNGVQELRIGVPWNLFLETCDPTILRIFRDAVHHMARMGANIYDADLGFSWTEVSAAVWPIMLSEAATVHLRDLKQRPQLFGREFRLFLETGLMVSATTYLNAHRTIRDLRDRLLKAFLKLDLLMLPTAGLTPAPLPAQPRNPSRWVSLNPDPVYTWVFNAVGFPAISVPCGFTADSLPVGFQLAAPSHAETVLFRAGFAYESSTPWVHCHPDL